MRGGLANLLHDIQRAPCERAIALALMDHGERLTGANSVGFYSLVDPLTPSEIHLRGVPDRVVELYETEIRPFDPLLQRVCQSHSAELASFDTTCAESSVASEFVRVALPMMREVIGTHEPSDYMLAPIVVGGEIVGTMNFAAAGRRRLDIRIGCALSIHVSARIAALRAISALPSLWDGALTTRQLELATLAARGMSTSDIARAAGVSPNTVKKHLKVLYSRLGVSSRAELASSLVRGPMADVPDPIERHRPRRATLTPGIRAFVFDGDDVPHRGR